MCDGVLQRLIDPGTATTQGGIRFHPAVILLRYAIAIGSRPRPARQLREPAAAVLHDPFLALEVDVHDPEALRVAERPLEIVEERPGEIALHWHAILFRPEHFPDVT